MRTAAAMRAAGFGMVLATAFAAAQAQAKIVTFAQFSEPGAGLANDLKWINPVIPAVYKNIPAVYQDIPAVIQHFPAVFQHVPAVTQVVNGKTVIVTPAHNIVVSPAHNVVITPAQRILVTPAQRVLVSPAHDGTSGTLFSTAAGVAGSPNVNFKFTQPILAQLGTLKASFSLHATAPAIDPATDVGGTLTQSDLSGSLSFIYAGTKTLTVLGKTYKAGADLLTISFTGLDLSGLAGGTTLAGLASSLEGDTVSYSSDFLKFGQTTAEQMNLGLGVRLGVQDTPGSALHSFIATASGQFGANNVSVPEPSAWTLMMVGIGGVGLALRANVRRRRPMAA